LIERLDEDLSREYQAIIAYVVYSQVLKGAQSMSAKEFGERVRQCEALGEYAIAEDIREILRPGTRTPDRSGDGVGRGGARRVGRQALTMRRAEKLSALGCGRPARRLIAVG